jgi:hypothetical protein
MIATHRKVMPPRIGISTAFDLANAAPQNVRGISVLLVTRHDAALATNALGHIEVESILFARSRQSARSSGAA